MYCYQGITEIIETLKKQGYEREFTCSDLHLLQPENWSVDHVIRYAGEPDQSDATTVYVLYQHSGGRKGLLLNGSGANSNPEKDEFLRRIPLTGTQIFYRS